MPIEAIRLYGNLPTATRNPRILWYVRRCTKPQPFAGMASTNASLGLVHSMAHKIGGEFGVTHGLSNAILLPYIIAYNRKSSNKYAYAEKMLGIENISDEIQRLNKEMDIPLTFKDCTEVDFSEEKFLSVLERMSAHAFEDPCTLTNPGKPTVADVKMIFEAAYYGKAIE